MIFFLSHLPILQSGHEINTLQIGNIEQALKIDLQVQKQKQKIVKNHVITLEGEKRDKILRDCGL